MQSPLTFSLIAVALAGCTATGRARPADPRMNWAFDQNQDEGAKLVYGVDSTDDVPVMLTCRPGSGVVTLSAAVPSTHVAPVVRLSSKGVSSDARGRLADDPLGPRLEAMAPTQLPALAAFAGNGRLSVRAGGSILTTAATDPAPVRRFFAACRS